MRYRVALVVALLMLGAAQPAQAGPFVCSVEPGISAAALNAGASWYFEVVGGQPNTTYSVKVNWTGDPSNGAHPNADVVTDAAGYGRTTLARWWSSDGALPGYFAFWDPYDPLSGYVAVPGPFTVHAYLHGGYGSAKCPGEVTS
jgi:hypothetical protein